MVLYIFLLFIIYVIFIYTLETELLFFVTVLNPSISTGVNGLSTIGLCCLLLYGFLEEVEAVTGTEEDAEEAVV